MTLPLVILAVFAVAAGWVGIPELPVLGGLIAGLVRRVCRQHARRARAAAEAYSLVPLFTSLVVALGGLYLGWLVYRRVKAGEPDPLAKPLGGVYTLLKNKYYVDEFYDLVFVKPAHWFSETFSYQWIDRSVIDGILHGIAHAAAWWLGECLRFWIRPAGDQRRRRCHRRWHARHGLPGCAVMQTGRVQQYMVVAVFGHGRDRHHSLLHFPGA